MFLLLKALFGFFNSAKEVSQRWARILKVVFLVLQENPKAIISEKVKSLINPSVSVSVITGNAFTKNIQTKFFCY